MLEYIYICRHGFRLSDGSNWTSQHHHAPTGMDRDYPLAALGLNQAEDLGRFLSDPERTAPYPPPERVFSSPFYRCVQTALPTAQALTRRHDKIHPISLDHGVQEWYSTTREGTGLHPRPGGPDSMAPHFPEGMIDMDYTSTVYASRRGETLRGLHSRIGLFLDAWIARMDEAGVRSAVIFGHAATVIAMGRLLTGDMEREVTAGCAVTSLYRRAGPLGGCGQWEGVYDGRADYMPGGVERDWAFSNIELANGEVLEEPGDGRYHPPEDELPVGLAPGMERYLRRDGGSSEAIIGTKPATWSRL
ncbi:uncharacterized protein CcaverHIS019_0209150 [Cutaneotrichosporon cavernicola]|uniref:Phosphoglycerate mutase-like protein n=1 Tax=Cutaneotrichosporon cavernicola TaxID=279322 RepID=A0AA48IIM6_9TREE|nr:uncharacterized protein CcaverHIS019_0209150 [Cutaneotrichosporon cavernicola]BEI89553.1 hypothetical protein CcaverHIS019_0209150 [Cutaneotrichosporon cavernicola]BEI97326.1 hypothetical protein CcaverHIS631_0209150 [Cutaneotrichosporon cavernicola]BEJ05100.1 hypothetical protein CcaverHIS641_0209170 [Cutaneotrichosporon cavernicola]